MKFFKISVLLLIAICLLSIPLWTWSNSGPAIPEKPFPDSRFININGTTVHYRFSKAVTDSALGNILLIHGFCGSSFTWRYTTPALTQSGFNVLSIDLPAFGYSDRSRGIDHSNVSRAKLIWAIADTIAKKHFLAESSWNIAGHSMGGTVAAFMAQAYPEKTKKLILTAPAIWIPESSHIGTYIMGSLPVRLMASVATKIYFYRYNSVHNLLRSAYAAEPDSATVNGYRNPLLIEGTTNAIIDQFISTHSNEALKFDKIKSECMLIWGDKDVWVPLSLSEKITPKMPAAKLEIIKNAGHCPMETNAPLYNDLLLKFMTDVK